MKKLAVVSLVLVGAVTVLHAQRSGSVTTSNAGPLPGFMRQYSETRGFILGRPVQVKPTPDGKHVLFLRAPPTTPRLHLFEFSVDTGQTRELLTPEMILKGAEEQLTVEEKARRERMRVTVGGFTSYELSDDGNLLLVPLSGKLYTFDRRSGAVRELPTGAGVVDPRLSPDGKSVAYVRDNDVHVLELGSQKAHAVTTGGSELVTHGLAEFVAQEEMNRMRGFWWSPDASLVAYEEADSRDVEEFNISDPMHPEKKPVSFRYPRAGKNNAQVKLGIIPVKGGKTTWVSWDRVKFPYLAHVSWERGAPLTILVQTRDQREEALLSVDTAKGTTTTLLTEKDDAWINIDPGMPMWLGDGSGFLWTTERNGAWELEHRDPRGALVKTLVPVGAGLMDVVSVDAQARRVYVFASGNPTETHLQWVSLDGGPLTAVTQTPARRLVTFAKNHALYVETRMPADGWRTVEVKNVDGKLIGELPQVAIEPPFKPNISWHQIGDGAGLYSAVIRPRDFDEKRRYPVVVSVYGGPHHNMVNASLEPYLREQWIADHGYIVVCVDGRGTQWRGRAWERAISGDFSTAPLQDQVTGVKLLAQMVPQMDLARVGVLGWSFGGFMSALAVMKRGDFFATGVAGAPVVDWADYDTHYTERYLNTPQVNPDGYKKSNLLSYAGELARPLLLIHGTADDNVYFFHSLKLSDALLRAGKDHAVLPLSGFTHMVPEPAVVEKLWDRMVGFLSETLHPERKVMR